MFWPDPEVEWNELEANWWSVLEWDDLEPSALEHKHLLNDTRSQTEHTHTHKSGHPPQNTSTDGATQHLELLLVRLRKVDDGVLLGAQLFAFFLLQRDRQRMNLEAVQTRHELSAGLRWPVFGVHHEEHVRKASAKVGAVRTKSVRSGRVDIVTLWTVRFNGAFAGYVVQACRPGKRRRAKRLENEIKTNDDDEAH